MPPSKWSEPPPTTTTSSAGERTAPGTLVGRSQPTGSYRVAFENEAHSSLASTPHQPSSRRRWSPGAALGQLRAGKTRFVPSCILGLLGGLLLLVNSRGQWLGTTLDFFNGLLPSQVESSRWDAATWNASAQALFMERLKSCDQEAEATLKAFFQDIVLIINNNYETHAANTTHFWRTLYSRFFGNVVVISASGLASLGIEAAASVYPNAPDPWWGTWMYHFWALKKIMARYPQAAGFLWTNDDVIINYWNLVGADKTKLWLPNNAEKYEYQFFDLYPTKEVEEQTKGNWASRIQYRQQVKLSLSLMDDRYKIQYDMSMLPRKNVYHKRGCDLFYIPQRHSPDIIQHVFPALQGGQLVSELAIPLMFFSLDPPQAFSPVLNDMVYRWDMWRSGAGVYNAKDHWTSNVSSFHPWKISSDGGKRELLKAMRNADGCLPKYFPKWM